jgi:Polyketide cyclase / dehydrase and lipid transport
MTLRDKTHINRDPGVVWRYIKDPLVMRSWNHGIREIVPISLGEPRGGFRYRVRYEIGGKVGNFEAEIMEFQEPLRLALHISGCGFPKGGYIQEVYELSGSNGRTILTRNIEVYSTGMSVVRRLAILLSHRFVMKAGRKCLLKLKELAEAVDPETGGIPANGNSLS